MLGQNATVLLFTDGLDRDRGEGIDRAIRRLKASSRRLVWLNPLLRYPCYPSKNSLFVFAGIG